MQFLTKQAAEILLNG